MGVLTTVTDPDVMPLITDGRSPAGIWTVSITAVGDGTGGNLEARFNPSTDLLRRWVWNFQGWTIYGVASVHTIVLEPCRKWTGGTQPLTFAQGTAGLDIGGNAMDAAALIKPNIGALIFQPTRPPTVAFVRCLILNALGRSLDFSIWGYIWHPTVLTTPGGPTRP